MLSKKNDNPSSDVENDETLKRLRARLAKLKNDSYSAEIKMNDISFEASEKFKSSTRLEREENESTEKIRNVKEILEKLTKDITANLESNEAAKKRAEDIELQQESRDKTIDEKLKESTEQAEKTHEVIKRNEELVNNMNGAIVKIGEMRNSIENSKNLIDSFTNNREVIEKAIAGKEEQKKKLDEYAKIYEDKGAYTFERLKWNNTMSKEDYIRLAWINDTVSLNLPESDIDTLVNHFSNGSLKDAHIIIMNRAVLNVSNDQVIKGNTTRSIAVPTSEKYNDKTVYIIAYLKNMNVKKLDGTKMENWININVETETIRDQKPTQKDTFYIIARSTEWTNEIKQIAIEDMIEKLNNWNSNNFGDKYERKFISDIAQRSNFAVLTNAISTKYERVRVRNKLNDWQQYDINDFLSPWWPPDYVSYIGNRKSGNDTVLKSTYLTTLR